MPRVKRAVAPRTHAEGKPVRGIRPGVRGPNKSQAEINAERDPATRPLQIIYNERSEQQKAADLKLSEYGKTRAEQGLLTFSHTAKGRFGSKAAKELQQLIQEIGQEIVNPNEGWSRIEAVVRRVYADALSGKANAQALIFERGWGKVPLPMKIDFKAEMSKVINEAGLTQEDIDNDPLLKQLVSGQVIEGAIISATEE